jgi:hypothetical protein
MAKYCVNTNAQPNGDHEVHKYSCERLPAEENRKYLDGLKRIKGVRYFFGFGYILKTKPTYYFLDITHCLLLLEK